MLCLIKLIKKRVRLLWITTGKPCIINTGLILLILTVVLILRCFVVLISPVLVLRIFRRLVIIWMIPKVRRSLVVLLPVNVRNMAARDEERYSRFNRTKRFRSAFWLGNWIILAVACNLALQSCGKLRYSILSYEVDTTYRSYNDTCIVEIWYRPFPRSKTTFRVKPAK